MIAYLLCGMSPKKLSEIINPYAELLVGLDKTVCHSVHILSHPVDQIKQALFKVATQVQEDKQLEDLGMMVAYLALFLTDTEMDLPDEQIKQLLATRMWALHDEFVEYVETHNPHIKE